jgi:hypothetical protein
MKYIIGACVGFILAVLVIQVLKPSQAVPTSTNDPITVQVQKDTPETTTTTNTEAGAPTPAAPVAHSSTTVSDQPAGSSVRVTLSDPSGDHWYVVHEVHDSVLGNALGAARFRRPTTGGVITLLRPTTSGGSYAVVPYTDNGDDTFSLKLDTPVRDEQGAVITQPFKAL